MPELVVPADLAAAQQMDQSKPVHSTIELAATVGSVSTAQRYARKLAELGFVSILGRGRFMVRSSLFQPYSLWPYLVPSLQALKKARYFGRTYNESDVHFAQSKFPRAIATLDYRAYELTKLQKPERLFLYVPDPEDVANELKREKFSEGRSGRVAILPKIGNFFQNEIQRVYLDCLAAGGRSLLDAVAIELLHSNELEVRGVFPIDLVEKVRDDLNARAPGITIESSY